MRGEFSSGLGTDRNDDNFSMLNVEDVSQNADQLPHNPLMPLSAARENDSSGEVDYEDDFVEDI